MAKRDVLLKCGGMPQGVLFMDKYIPKMSQEKIQSLVPEFPWLTNYIFLDDTWEIKIKKMDLDVFRRWVDVGTCFHSEFDTVFLLDENGICIDAVGCSVKKEKRSDNNDWYAQRPIYRTRKHFFLRDNTIEKKLATLSREQAAKVIYILWVSHTGQMNPNFYCKYERYTSVTIYKPSQGLNLLTELKS
jgi:hypothetical protein